MTISLQKARTSLSMLALIALLMVSFASVAFAGPEDASGFITGVVWQDSNGNGIREPFELPLANHPVYLQRTGEEVVGAMAAMVLSDAKGNFRFENLEVGHYQIAPDGGAFQLIDVQGVNATTTVNLPAPTSHHLIFLPLAQR